MLPEVLRVVEEDELCAPEIGEYARHKYALLYGYARIFSTSMKAKWRNRVYVDLFSAAGKGRIKQTGELVRTSPLIALGVPDPFTKYIFCEEDSRLMEALRIRVEREHPRRDCALLLGDANQLVDKILEELPRYGPDEGLLCFCFVDPSRMSDLRFSTIAALASRKVDFLTLIPTGMEFNRFNRDYFGSSSSVVEDFCGVPEWRSQFVDAQKAGVSPERFLMELFDSQMRTLGYEYGGADDAVAIRLPEKNLILYHLAFYSRHALARSFFKEAAKYSLPQQELF